MTSKNPLLDKRLVNAFIDSVIKTLKTMAMTETKVEKPIVQDNFVPKGDIAGLIGMVAGEFRGNLTFSFEKKAVFTILKNMLNEEFSVLNEEVNDAVGELTNMIYGSAKTKLNEIGYKFEMAIPSVISGNFTISKYHNGTTLVIPFSIETDKFYVEITIQ